jgi:3alpha(or 20beta)-hydroxysteroid dehydrogenase
MILSDKSQYCELVFKEKWPIGPDSNEELLVSREFEEKVFLITGGGSGIGRAQGLILAERGAKVWVTDISIESGAETVELITAKGGLAKFQKLDVTNTANWQELFELIELEDGKLDGLVNNAGVSNRAGISDTSVEEWHRVIEINLSSVFYGMKTMAPLIAKAGGGSIVNVSSIAGMVGYFSASYAASKWGVRGLSKVGATEFAKSNIRVNSILPGLVDTPMLRSGSPNFRSEIQKSVPANRLGEADEMAEAAIFLLSDKSRYINGSEIVIDGGLSSNGLFYRILNDLEATESTGK